MICQFLFSKGTDFYGNKIEPFVQETSGFRLSREDRVHEQVFWFSSGRHAVRQRRSCCLGTNIEVLTIPEDINETWDFANLT